MLKIFVNGKEVSFNQFKDGTLWIKMPYGKWEHFAFIYENKEGE